MEEEAYEVNTNGADVAIQVGIILHQQQHHFKRATTRALN